MMLRDVTKSALSLSWALSLLGIKQAVDLMQPHRQPGGNAFGPIAQVAVDQLDESMKDIYRSGENVQGSMVDMAFALLDPRTTNGAEPAQEGDHGNPGSVSSPSCGANIFNLVNPMNWMNPVNFVRGMQNCPACGGQAEQSGQQPIDTQEDVATSG